MGARAGERAGARTGRRTDRDRQAQAFRSSLSRFLSFFRSSLHSTALTSRTGRTWARARPLQRKRRTHVRAPETAYEEVPRSFVLRAGVLGSSAHTLVRDFRRIMQPYTAVRLREGNHNRMSDVLKSAAVVGVTHLVLFKQTDAGTNVRFARAPQGPTLQFRVVNYTLMADLAAAQARPRSPGAEYKTPPLVRSHAMRHTHTRTHTAPNTAPVLPSTYSHARRSS